MRPSVMLGRILLFDRRQAAQLAAGFSLNPEFP
jgi:hypothetical protein